MSSLKKTQVVDIFHQYLDRHCGGGNASELICDFLAIETMDEAVLNPGSGQRILFVAANFRREVTATALWLIGRGIAVQCFRVTPFAFKDELFLDLPQIIPPPEAADYIIGISSKEVEEPLASQSRAGDTVIPPFLPGPISRIYAAISSFCLGVMPPMAILGRSLLYVQSQRVA